MDRKDIARHLLQIHKAEENFFDFIQAINPDWEIPDFQYTLAMALDLLEKRELTSGFTGKLIKNKSGTTRNLHPSNFTGKKVNSLMINMPPRHAKSTFATMLFPAWYEGRDPRRAILSCSYNSTLAVDFGRAVREILEHPLYPQIFPDFSLHPGARAADSWRTEDGGTYFSIGLGGTTSGRPANLLIFDDPIKNRSEAESITMRNRAWQDYTSSLISRKQPEPNGLPPIEINIATRWHPDDVSGRIQNTEAWKGKEWVHLKMPAIWETESEIERSVALLPKDDPRYSRVQPNSPSKRYYKEPIFHALWPERFPLKELQKKQRLDPREFEALYQQNPYIEGGEIIKSSDWRYYTPEDYDPNLFPIKIIAADTAFKKTERSDYSVFIIMAMNSVGEIYIIDLVRERLEYPELKRRLISLNSIWRGQGLRGIYVEDKASGQSLIQELRAQSGMTIIPYRAGTTDKDTRVHTITPLIQSGRVYLPTKAKWLDNFINECTAFPNTSHDDQVDALVIGLDALSRMHTGNHSDIPDGLFNKSLNDLVKSQKSLMPKMDLPHAPWRGWGL